MNDEARKRAYRGWIEASNDGVIVEEASGDALAAALEGVEPVGLVVEAGTESEFAEILRSLETSDVVLPPILLLQDDPDAALDHPSVAERLVAWRLDARAFRDAVHRLLAWRQKELALLEEHADDADGAEERSSDAEGAMPSRRDLDRICHDMRGHLNAITGYGELLADKLSERGVDDLTSDVERILHAGREMLGIVNKELSSLTSPTPEDAGDRALTSADLVDPQSTGTILIVDDDGDLRELMAAFLKSEGFNVETASEGHEGLRMARERPPAVMTLDVEMPNLDGWGVLDEMKKDEALASIPVVMLTGSGSERVAALALRYGVRNYLIKGDITADALGSAIRDALTN